MVCLLEMTYNSGWLFLAYFVTLLKGIDWLYQIMDVMWYSVNSMSYIMCSYWVLFFGRYLFATNIFGQYCRPSSGGTWEIWPYQSENWEHTDCAHVLCWYLFRNVVTICRGEMHCGYYLCCNHGSPWCLPWCLSLWHHHCDVTQYSLFPDLILQVKIYEIHKCLLGHYFIIHSDAWVSGKYHLVVRVAEWSSRAFHFLKKPTQPRL